MVWDMASVTRSCETRLAHAAVAIVVQLKTHDTWEEVVPVEQEEHGVVGHQRLLGVLQHLAVLVDSSQA